MAGLSLQRNHVTHTNRYHATAVDGKHYATRFTVIPVPHTSSQRGVLAASKREYAGIQVQMSSRFEYGRGQPDPTTSTSTSTLVQAPASRRSNGLPSRLTAPEWRIRTALGATSLGTAPLPTFRCRRRLMSRSSGGIMVTHRPAQHRLEPAGPVCSHGAHRDGPRSQCPRSRPRADLTSRLVYLRVRSSPQEARTVNLMKTS